jgi:hypothetical protein
MSTNILSAYSGYVFTISDKLKISFHSSYNSGDKYNCSNCFNIKVNDHEIPLTINEAETLADHLRKMIDLSDCIPNKDNAIDFISF